MTIPQLLNKVSQVTGVHVYEIIFKNKTRKVVYARTMAIAALRYYCPECDSWTLARMGRLFGRDHSSICNDLQRHANLMQLDYDNYVENYKKITTP